MKGFTLLLPLCLASASAFGGAWSNLWLTPDQQGQRSLESGNPEAAASLFEDPRRRAYAEMKAGHYAQAAQHLADQKDADSLYNRGNALARAGKLREALAAYDAALAQQPADRDAKHNRDLVARALEQQRKQNGAQGGNGQEKRKGGGNGASGSDGNAGSNSSNSGNTGGGSGHDDSRGDRGSGGAGASAIGTPSATRAPTAGQSAAGNSHEAAGSKSDAEQAKRDAAASLGLAGSGQEAKPSGGETNGQSTTQDALTPNAAREHARPPAPKSEQALALDQWLRRIPDDSSGLLRRKFLIEHLMRQKEAER